MATVRQRAAQGLIVAMICLMPMPLFAQSHVPSIGARPAEPEPDMGPLPADFESGASFIDSAMTRSVFRLRFDVNQRNVRPTRAEYLFPSDGFPLPETRISTQELQTYVEYGLNQWFSTFLETPFKWVNPEQNANLYGVGDLHFGMKFAGWNSESFLTALQIRFGANTSQHALTGTGHWSVEPSLLLNWRFMPYLTLEGQAGFYMPLGGTDYAGDVFRYGAALSYGSRTASAVQLMPVAELVGWTVTSGKELTSPAPGVFLAESSAGNTIVNGCLGLRFSLGHSGDIYAGYSRCLTDNTWYRDMFRVEFRLFY